MRLPDNIDASLKDQVETVFDHSLYDKFDLVSYLPRRTDRLPRCPS